MNNQEMTKEIQYTLWERNDPRIIGDNYSEVSRTIVFIGTHKDALAQYQHLKNARKFGGCKHIGIGYPIKSNDDDVLGKKIVEYPAKTEPDDDDFYDNPDKGVF